MAFVTLSIAPVVRSIPQRFWHAVNHQLDGVIRSKGYFWLASRPEYAAMWSQAGAVARQGYAGRWWVSVPRTEWPQDADSLNFIAEQWQEGTGDARQELVFIGIEMDEKSVRAALDHALLTPQEMAAGPEQWITLADPVPAWFDETTA
ncbi:Cobalamin synthesis protein cobW C-terminal domain [Pantoea agglomerans]|uniref:Cobalamin synthesis protein cobW C-terminal domain n=1 Tax=Enterobacter agglomerans TaxID=549 RepID=A0A379LUG4_ENTAG|nr:Cobalamin synthesis protein cobW C-terminal domain [Pantoea agglomerans]